MLEYLKRKFNDKNSEKWKRRIEQGFVTVDCEVSLDPGSLKTIVIVSIFRNMNHSLELKVSTDVLVEFVDVQISIGVPEELDGQEKDTKPNIISSTFDDLSTFKNLESFVLKVAPLFLNQLADNLVVEQKVDMSALLYSSDRGTGSEDEAAMTYWRLLTVDLEKKKVVFPDWSQQAKHYPAVVQRCVLTRNKERVYDIEYDDGSKLTGVREEYIRLLGGNQNVNVSNVKIASRLQEGVRVHAKVTFKGGIVKYLPGRVVKCYRSSSTGGGGAGGVYDVECEGSRLEKGLTLEGLIIGLTGRPNYFAQY